MRRYIIFSLLAAIASISTNAFSNTNNVLDPPNFKDLSYKESNVAVYYVVWSVAEAKSQRISPGYITNLVYQLRTENLPDDKNVLIIYLLGELQASNAAALEVLVEHIDLKTQPDLKPSGPFSMRWGAYPAREALIKIGRPAIGPLINHLTTETKEFRRHLMCSVLTRVEGVETATSLIKQKVAGESDPAKRVNLELALKEIEKL